MDRISEVLFGLIMALTFTCTLGVATAGHIEVRTMLIGALGCNLAWGIIDGGVHLLAGLNERGRAVVTGERSAMRRMSPRRNGSSQMHCRRSSRRFWNLRNSN
jgi:hypothetical protein